jgi:hypothetical protein
MARLELDESGHLMLDGEPHVVDPRGLAAARAASPRFVAAVKAIIELISWVDDAEWQRDTNTMFVELLDAMHTEVFGSCCPQCRAVVDATFGASLSTMVS